MKALKELNLISMPIEATNKNKKIQYINCLDMKEIFISLNLCIPTNKNCGCYEIDFKIHALTLQGVKFGIIFIKLYSH